MLSFTNSKVSNSIFNETEDNIIFIKEKKVTVKKKQDFLQKNMK